jgi:hypothetical protein
MKTGILFLMTFLLFLPASLLSQEEHKRSLIIETGFAFIGCEPPEKDYIRAVAEPNYYNYYSDNISALSTHFFAGVKYEYRIVENSIALCPGLRYSRVESEIGRNGYSQDDEFFYVRYSTSGQSSEFARVRSITQSADFLGIPLEVRFYPQRERRINIFYKMGGSFNVKLHSSNDIDFYNSYMNRYRSEAIGVVEESFPWYTTLYFGAGIKTFSIRGVGISVECDAPLGLILPKGEYFVNPVMGGSFQVVCSVPLTRKTEQ